MRKLRIGKVNCPVFLVSLVLTNFLLQGVIRIIWSNPLVETMGKQTWKGMELLRVAQEKEQI